MRIFRSCSSAGLQGNADRLHFIFLCIGNDPFRQRSGLLVLLLKVIRIVKYDLTVCLIVEELFQIRAQRLKDVYQGGNGRGCEIPLDL